jgi:Raf kinase inhibitor-like YbhB/YbcL family protein
MGMTRPLTVSPSPGKAAHNEHTTGKLRSAVAWLAGFCFLAVLVLAACDSNSSTPSAAGGTAQSMMLASPAFAGQQPIPKKYSCDGQSISPPLQWSAPPTGTKSLALILDDPDAPGGTFVHWVLYDLPPTARSLPEGVPTVGDLPDGSKQGRNGSGTIGYTGPCPPYGTHHYHFKLYALDTVPYLPSGAGKSQLEQATDKHVLAYGELVGTYSK